MKFILLGSGKIAEKLFTDSRFKNFIPASLSGLIVSKNIGNIAKKLMADKQRLPLFEIKDKQNTENELHDLIHKTNPDYVFSIQYPWILPQKTIELMKGRILNLHNAELPKYRGHNTITHELLNGEKTHTSTLHWISSEVDRGRTVSTKEITIMEDDTAFSLWSRSVDSSIQLLEEWLINLDKFKVFPEGQPVNKGGRFYSKNIQSLKKIPHGSSSQCIEKWARAFWFPPHEPAYLQYEGKKLYVLPDNWVYQEDKLKNNKEF